MTERGITEAQRAAVAALAPVLDADTYLAGGVAIAMVLRHRTSLDIDLFVPRDFDAERLAERVSAGAPEARIVGRAAATLHLEVQGIPVSILSYRYPMLEPLQARAEVPLPVAALEDLACMKVSAIAGRGAAKDFWDLHELLRRGVAGGTLAGVLDRYQKKYRAEDIGHAIRSLAYFGDADASPLPRGLAPEAWTDIKAAMRQRVKAL